MPRKFWGETLANRYLSLCFFEKFLKKINQIKVFLLPQVPVSHFETTLSFALRQGMLRLLTHFIPFLSHRQALVPVLHLSNIHSISDRWRPTGPHSGAEEPTACLLAKLCFSRRKRLPGGREAASCWWNLGCSSLHFLYFSSLLECLLYVLSTILLNSCVAGDRFYFRKEISLGSWNTRSICSRLCLCVLISKVSCPALICRLHVDHNILCSHVPRIFPKCLTQSSISMQSFMCLCWTVCVCACTVCVRVCASKKKNDILPLGSTLQPRTAVRPLSHHQQDADECWM